MNTAPASNTAYTPLKLSDVECDQALPYNLFIHVAGHYIKYRHQGDPLEAGIRERLLNYGLETIYADQQPQSPSESIASEPAPESVLAPELTSELETEPSTNQEQQPPEEALTPLSPEELAALEPSTDVSGLTDTETVETVSGDLPELGAEEVTQSAEYESEKITHVKGGAPEKAEKDWVMVTGKAGAEQEETQTVSGASLPADRSISDDELDALLATLTPDPNNSVMPEGTDTSLELPQTQETESPSEESEASMKNFIEESTEQPSAFSDKDLFATPNLSGDLPSLESTIDLSQGPPPLHAGESSGTSQEEEDVMRVKSLGNSAKEQPKDPVKATQLNKSIIQKLLQKEKKNPKDITIKVALAKAYAEANRIDEAIVIYKNMKRTFAKNPSGSVGLIECYISKKWIVKAQTEYEELLGQYPNNPQVEAIGKVLHDKITEEEMEKSRARQEAQRVREAGANQREANLKKIFSK